MLLSFTFFSMTVGFDAELESREKFFFIDDSADARVKMLAVPRQRASRGRIASRFAVGHFERGRARPSHLFEFAKKFASDHGSSSIGSRSSNASERKVDSR